MNFDQWFQEIGRFLLAGSSFIDAMEGAFAAGNAAPTRDASVAQILEDESQGAWAAFEKSVHADMSNKSDLWPIWEEAWETVLATRDTPTDQEPIHVGDSKFEEWFAQHPTGQHLPKQFGRDAYEAGLNERATPADHIAQAKDAERYRWLSDRFIGCDFDWMPSAENAGDGKSVLCFEIGRDCRVWGDAGMTIDLAIAASAQRDK